MKLCSYIIAMGMASGFKPWCTLYNDFCKFGNCKYWVKDSEKLNE